MGPVEVQCGLGLVAGGEGTFQDQEFLHDASPHQVFLDDALEDARVAFAIPGALGIDYRDGPTLADAEAVGLGAIDPPQLREAELLEPALQVAPGFQGSFPVAALGLGLVGAQEDVPTDPGDPQGLRLLPLAGLEVVDRYTSRAPWTRPTIFAPGSSRIPER